MPDDLSVSAELHNTGKSYTKWLRTRCTLHAMDITYSHKNCQFFFKTHISTIIFLIFSIYRKYICASWVTCQQQRWKVWEISLQCSGTRWTVTYVIGIYVCVWAVYSGQVWGDMTRPDHRDLLCGWLCVVSAGLTWESSSDPAAASWCEASSPRTDHNMYTTQHFIWKSLLDMGK